MTATDQLENKLTFFKARGYSPFNLNRRRS